MDWLQYIDRLNLGDFVTMDIEGARVLVRDGYQAHAEFLAGLRVPDGARRSKGGRAPHPIVPLGGTGTHALVRRYHRGGLLRHINRDRYFAGHRAFAELAATERARRAGVSIPLVLAAAEHPATIGYRAVLATLWIPSAAELPDWLAREHVERRTVFERIGEQIRRMHEAGIAHPDLNLRNILVTEDGGIVLLDFDRAVSYEGPAPTPARRRNLLRMARSARKLGIDLSNDDWSAIAAGYGTGWPLAEPRG